MSTGKIIVFCLPFLLGGCFDPPKVKIQLEGRPMPSFELILQDSVTHLHTDSIPEGRPVVLFYFNPDCPYCKAQMKDITTNIAALTNIDFYLLTNYDYNELKSFYKDFNLVNYPNIIAGIDYTNYFNTHFPVSAVPFLVIYDKDKRLKKILVGRHDINIIRQMAFR
jgi:thiol-disulfide isomerase/thioredoxin